MELSKNQLVLYQDKYDLWVVRQSENKLITWVKVDFNDSDKTAWEVPTSDLRLNY